MVDALKPCPFCGTHPDDADHPSVSVETFDAHQTECGKCGACWPKLKRSDLSDDMTGDDLIAFLNRRSTLSDAVAECDAEPVAWLPTATVKWLEEYEGPACGTQTVAHNRPIKSDGGVPVYLAPPTSELEALRKRVAELEKALEHDQWSIIDRAIERYSNGEISDLHALGLITAGFLKLDAARDAARRVREGGKVDAP